MSLSTSRRRFLLATGAALAGLRSGGNSARAGENDLTPATIRLNGWLETRFEAWLAASPMQQSSLGLKTAFDKWDDLGPARWASDKLRAEKDLADLRENFGADSLSDEGRLSYRLYEYESEKRISDSAWRGYEYPVNQQSGWQQQIASFLINIHRVDTVEDAEAYVARLNGVGAVLDQVMANMRDGEAKGVLAPRFVYGHVIRDCRNLLAGAPFGPGADSPLYADFTAKLDGLKAERVLKQALRADAAQALSGVVGPAYQKLMALAEAQASRAGVDDGAWRLPDGEAYYAHQLKYATTTPMTAAEIHVFGLDEVKRIHGEMRALMRKMDFTGDLRAFFAFLKTDPKFRYARTADGKAAYIARTREIIAAMDQRLLEAFSRKPAGELAVQAVPAFREQSATSAFYQGPGAYDGRPGTYFINTFDMAALPIYEMEAIAYHEAIPGHHLQVSYARALSDIPRFRRFSGSFIAYSEGWGLYCERLAKDMGFYQDATADFGRLSSELWRACRLVVDSGIHAGETKWSREKAIAYLQEATPNSAGDIVNSVERYIVGPGQAAAYKVGMSRILDLRETAKARLAEKFDLREFHDVVLGHGALPLTMLAENVEAWVKVRGA
jgi:uncharacterized protein (DUF885 family)